MKRKKDKLLPKVFLLGMLLLFSQQILSQVRGKVSDAEGNPLPGATIVEKGTNNGVISDVDGNYEIKVRDLRTAVLVFSFVGMETQEIQVAGKSTINVTLKESIQAIDELVVVGYGTQKKASVVASISTIGSDEIVQSPVSNISVGLAGKMPGLTIMFRNGELGRETIQTFIRGQATMNTTAPLVLVDGVEREMNTIDPYDIESISILKDASATAVYGVRGANGVILVTTKKGIIGKPQITAHGNYSLQTPTRLPKPLNAIDYMTVRNEVVALDNPNNPVPYPEEVFEHYRKGDLPEYYVDRNWYKEFMNKYTPMYNANVNIRGGNEKTKYFASVGYMNQGGPFKTERWSEYNYDNEQKLDRFTYRANIDMQITKSLKGWMNLSGYLQDKNDPIIYGGIADAATTASYYYLLLAQFTDIPSISFPDLTPEGNVVSVPGKDRVPYGSLNRTGYRVTTNNQINNTVGLEQRLDFVTKGLSARAIVSYDSRATHVRGFRRTYQTYIGQLVKTATGQDSVSYVQGDGVDSELVSHLTQSFSNSFDLEASLNYSRTFGKHDVTGLLLYKQNQEIINNQVPFNYVGIVGRGTYNYDQRYLAEFNFGMNGSEQFAPGRRFGFFPSLSLGWVLSEEKFMKSNQAIEFLKIRGSFGQVGNDRISSRRFIYLDDWTQGEGGYFSGTGAIPGLPQAVYQNTMPNEFVKWEVSNKGNIGFESRFKNGFEWDLDLFYEKRSSILIDETPIPSYLFGQINLPPVNDGVMTNRGFETSVTYSKNFNKDLFLMTRFSAAFARNRIENSNETPYDDTFAYPYRTEGFPRNTIWGFDCLGYFKDQQEIDSWADQTGLGASVLPGDLKYADKNGDHVIDEKDMIPMKHPTVPELNLSFAFNVDYKGFDLSVLLHGVTNYTYNFSGRAVYDWEGNDYGGIKNYFELHKKYAWTPEKVLNGGDIRYPRMHVDGVTVSKQPSNYWLIDLWYFRIKNLELGYTFPKSLSSSIGLQKLRIYFNGFNLLTIDNMPFKYFDPEVPNSLQHPIFANYNVGLNVTF